MSDPQTFEELKRMASELPKNVLVPAHHIHSLLDETERLVERVADLKRQLAEKQAELVAMRHAANEWADVAVNGLQWIRNINDGVSTSGEALTAMESDVAHCRVIGESRKQP